MKPPHTISSVLGALYQATPQAQALLGELERKLRTENLSWDDDVIPTLKELVLTELGILYPIENLLECDKSTILEKIPLDIPLKVAVDNIPDGYFWERLAKSRWSKENFPRPRTICNVADYGNSWRRLVLERHLQEFLEVVDPEVTEIEEIADVFKMCADHVRCLDIREMKRQIPISLPESIAEEDPPESYISDHLNLSELLPELHSLEEFHLTYTKRYMGDNFKWDELRVSIKDLEGVGKGLAKVPSLQMLHIHRSKVDDYRIAALLRPLVEVHHPLFHLDFSHCQIGDTGALALAATMLELPNLHNLILTNNRIGARGAKGLAYAIVVLTAQDFEVRVGPNESQTGSSVSHNRLLFSQPLLEGYSFGKRLSKEPTAASCVSRMLETSSGLSVSTSRTIKGYSMTSAHSGLTRTLDILDLSLNPIGDLGGMYIASAIIQGGGPSIIDMAGCALGNAAGLHLAESLRFTQLVQAMDLSSNPLSESAGKAFVEVLYENVHILQLDLRDSFILAEDLGKIAESLEQNWERRRELWELQRIQERRISVERGAKFSDSSTYRGCNTSDRASALASSAKLKEHILFPLSESLTDMKDDVQKAFDNLREEDAEGGGDKEHVYRQICERDPELIDDDGVYCRDALDSLVPLNVIDERCQIPNLREGDEEATGAGGDLRASVTSNESAST